MSKRKLIMTCLILAGCLITRPANAGLNVLAGISTPASVGILNDTDPVGIMAQARLMKGVLPFLTAGQSIGYVRLAGNPLTGSSSAGLNIIPILTMVQLSPPIPGIKPYVNAGLGIYYLSRGSASIASTIIKSATTTKFGYTAGGGLIFGFPGPVDFQLDVSYHNIQTSGSATSFVGVQGGVQIGLF